MLRENTPVRQQQSALDRRIAMGLDSDVQSPLNEDIDVGEFMADDDSSSEEDSE